MEDPQSKDLQSNETDSELVPAENITDVQLGGTLAVRSQEFGSAVSESLFGPVRDLLNLRKHHETKYYWRVEGHARNPNELLRTVQSVLEDHRFGTIGQNLRLNRNLRFETPKPVLIESPSTMTGRANYEGSVEGIAQARNPRIWVMLVASAISVFLFLLSLLVQEIWLLFAISAIVSFLVIRNEMKWDRAVVQFTTTGEMYQAENVDQQNLEHESRGRTGADLNSVVSGRLEIDLGQAKGNLTEVKNNSVSDIFDHQVLSGLIIGTLIERYPDMDIDRT